MLAARLIRQAHSLYDDPDLPFAQAARMQSWRTDFASGAAWMRLVMSHVRGADIPANADPYNALGLLKYGLASLASLAYLVLMISVRWWGLLPGFVLVFYAVEAQMVFLFPLTIDGCGSSLALSRHWMQRAGGTSRVMGTVMCFAVVMLFGGFAGGGFVRSWALGCLAVVLWYEEVRRAEHRRT